MEGSSLNNRDDALLVGVSIGLLAGICTLFAVNYLNIINRVGDAGFTETMSIAIATTFNSLKMIRDCMESPMYAMHDRINAYPDCYQAQSAGIIAVGIGLLAGLAAGYARYSYLQK